MVATLRSRKRAASRFRPKKLFEVVRSLAGEEISFSMKDGSWLEITCGNSFFRLVGLAPDDFPEVPQNDFSRRKPSTTMPSKSSIGQTIFAVTQEDARYALNGALLEMDPQVIRMVATDAHRLAMVEESFDSEAEVRAIVPKKTLTELRNLGSGGEMLFAQDEHHLFFKIGHRVLATRESSKDSFPSYEKVIPAENPLEIVFRQGVDGRRHTSASACWQARGPALFASSSSAGEAIGVLEQSGARGGCRERGRPI